MSKRPILVAVALVVGIIASFFVVPPAYQRWHYIAVILVGSFAIRTMLSGFQRATDDAAAVVPLGPESVLREGPANLKDGWVMVGGVLKLTPHALVFSAHGFAQKARVHTWDLRQLESVAPSRALGLIPNAITARIAGVDVKLVVTYRELWMRDIQRVAESLRQRAAQNV